MYCSLKLLCDPIVGPTNVGMHKVVKLSNIALLCQIWRWSLMSDSFVDQLKGVFWVRSTVPLQI